MRLNVKQHVLDYEGKPLMTNKTNPDGSVVLGDDNRPVQEPELLRNYLAVALNNAAQSENEIFTPEQKAKIYELTTKLYKRKEVDLTLDDRSFLKERVGKVYGPLIYGRICDILEEKEPELPDEVEEEPVSQSSKSKASKGAATDGGE
jgi:hypothetical protein